MSARHAKNRQLVRFYIKANKFTVVNFDDWTRFKAIGGFPMRQTSSLARGNLSFGERLVISF